MKSCKRHELLSRLFQLPKVADFAGFIAYDDQGEEIFTFGKYRGKTVQSVLKENPGYYSWIQNADFPLYTKKVLTAIKLEDLITDKYEDHLYWKKLRKARGGTE